MTPVPRGAALTLLVATCSALGVGCGKDKQSLVLVNLRLAIADDRAMNLKSVKLTANPGPTREFPLSMLSADMNTELGLYLPGSVSGDVSILAIAEPSEGCVGFRGSGGVVIESSGETKAVLVLMQVANTCIDDGGVGGSGGTAGTTGGGGAAGTGTSGGGTTGVGGTTGGGGMAGGMGGMAGYPAIASCRTFNHATNATCPNVSVRAVAISRNGQLVASAGDDGRVKIWNFNGRMLTAAGTEFMGFTGYGVAFSPDGTRLAYTSGTMIRTVMVSGWTASTTLLNDGSSNDMVSVAFTPNGQRIVSADAIGNPGGDVFAHEVGGSALPAFTKHIARQPASLAVSPVAAGDGSVGVAVGTYGNGVSVLTLGASAFTDPIVLAASTATAAVWTVEFSSDGSLVAMGDINGLVRFWGYPVTSTSPVGNDITFAGGDGVNDIAFSPNGTYVAVGGALSVNQLSIYNLSTRAEADRTTPVGSINALVFSPNGAAIIAGLYECSAVMVCN